MKFIGCFLAIIFICGVTTLDKCECSLTSDTLSDIAEIKANVKSMIASLRAYGRRLGIDIPNPATPTIDDVTNAIPTTTSTNMITTTPISTTEAAPPKDCLDVLRRGGLLDGVYEIIPTDFMESVQVYCDQTTDGGGWTVFQRRHDGSVNFTRTFNQYANGFGELTGEFWLGNNLISALSTQSENELRIDMTDFSNVTAFARYYPFRVDGMDDNFRLTVRYVDGTAGDSLGYHNKAQFSTFQVDNDASSIRNCALRHNGGWWFKNCMRANLNGFYFTTGQHDSYADGIEWSRFRGLKYSMKFTEMKMRAY